MPEKRKQAGKRVVQRLRPKWRSMSTAEIREWNRRVAARRSESLEYMSEAMRSKDCDIERAVRRVAKKFARLPFGCINECCEGHFYRENAASIDDRIPLGKAAAGEKLLFEPGYFELELDLSAAAMEFRAALQQLKKMPGVRIRGGSAILNVEFIPKLSEKPFSKNQALAIWAGQLRFIQNFEALVDRFVAKYGVKVRL